MSVVTPALRFEHVGLGTELIDYQHAWQLQRQVHENVVAGRAPDTVLLLEHPPTYTAGKRTNSWERPTDGVHKRPVVVEGPDGEDAIAIRPVGVLALAWDHRAFDGAYAAAFLRAMKETLETRDWEAELA